LIANYKRNNNGLRTILNNEMMFTRISNAKSRTINYIVNNHINYHVTSIFVRCSRLLQFKLYIRSWGKTVLKKIIAFQVHYLCELEQEDNLSISHFKDVTF